METALRVLIIEDSRDDAEILVWELKKAGFAAAWERVETSAELETALNGQIWDVALSDYVMPSFSGLEALKQIQSKGVDIPFIMISGKMGEETAVEAMRAGAGDYLLKGQLARLGPVIRRELAEADIRRQRRQSEKELTLLKKAIETLPIGVTICDMERKIIFTNPAEADMHGYAVEELIGLNVRALAPERTWRTYTPHPDPSGNASYRRESVNQRKDGSLFPTYIISTLVTDEDGAPMAAISTCEDITARKEAEIVIRKQLAAMESSIDGMVITGDGGRILFLNHAQIALYGFSSDEELTGRSWHIFYGDEERKRLEEEAIPALRRDGQWRGEAYGTCRDGSTFPQEVSLTVFNGAETIWVIRDISERKRAEEKLRYLSTHDPLTGLYNRLYFEEELERLERSRLFPVGVVMIDVDGLKQINDTLGHAAGDKLLQKAGRLLVTVFRGEDMVARIGGDEFVVLLPAADEAAVSKALERVRSSLSAQVADGDGALLSLSLGMATATQPETLLDALKLADKDMYQNKARNLCRRKADTL